MKTYQQALDEMAANANYDNPFLPQAVAYQRRVENRQLFDLIQSQIEKLFYPQFISYPEDAEFIEALIRLTMSKRILEVGMYTGFTTLHMIRAVYPDGHVVAIDNQKVYPDFFKHPEIARCFDFMHGDSLETLRALVGPFSGLFDLVYVDSDHSLEHTDAEVQWLWQLTRPGSIFVFHDCPEKHQPGDEPESGTIYRYLQDMVRLGKFRGLVLPSANRLDMPDSPRECLPHLGVFIRT